MEKYLGVDLGDARTGLAVSDSLGMLANGIGNIESGSINKTAEEAMRQIKEKHYATKFLNRGKRIMLIGANFDSEKGQLTDWLKEEVR